MSFRPSARAVRRALATAGLSVVLAATLAGCGGGTSQREPFVPLRYFAFGDEASVLTTDGRKYSVNALTTAGAHDCTTEPIWTQVVASTFSLRFAECNPDAAEPKAFLLAAAGATAADLKAQVDARVAAGGFASKDLATVLVGAHDVLEQYARFPAVPEAELTAELRRRGEAIAVQVNRLIDLGVRVVVATVPDMGLTPFALAQKAAFTDTDRAALLSRLTAAVNGRIRVNILNDGRFVGLVLADELVQAIVASPSFYGVTNTTAAVCTVALPDCTSATLVESGSSAAYLWADATRMAWGGAAAAGFAGGGPGDEQPVLTPLRLPAPRRPAPAPQGCHSVAAGQRTGGRGPAISYTARQ